MEEVEATLLEGGISWLAETILENLAETAKLDAWIRQVGLADDAAKLTSEIERVEAVVADLKGRAIGNRSLARSLGRLRELLYDADDAVDELDYYRLHQQVQGSPESADGHGGAEQTERPWGNAGEGEASGSGGKRRSGVWQHFDIVEEKNGKTAKAKCVDCHTVVKCGSDNGTSVLHNHRNSSKCKRKREAAHQLPNLLSASEGAVSGNSAANGNSVGRKRMRTEGASTDHVAANSHPWNKAELSNRIQCMTHQLQETVNEVTRQCRSASSNQSRQGTPPATNATTSSYLLEPKVYGRDAEIEYIKNLIMSNKSNGITVLPIVGIGGIGKTTLSQRVYNDPEIGNQFEIKIWVHVSYKFDVVSITREILQCVSHQSYQGISNFNMLQQDLEKHMKSKKFLIVLDDVWDVTTEDCWNKLLCPLRPNHVNTSQEAAGNIIIVTTRIQNVAKRCGTAGSINLKALQDGDISQLFKAYAFGNNNPDSYTSLQLLGKQIVRELNGIPLAVKTVGRLLSRNLTIGHWNSIIEHKEWQSLKHTDGIMHALKLSYDHLPRHLQQCFSYCYLFPKGYSFSEAQLIQIWIAQGFVEKSSEKLEQKGWEYLAELVDSGFFQQVERMQFSSELYVMSDLMHDLARMISQTEYATIDGSECRELAPSIRHLSILTDSAYRKDQNGNISRNEEFEKRLLEVTSRSKLRTLVLIGQYDSLLFKSFKDAFKEAQHLRLLHITSRYGDFGNFFSRLVNCTHLRYLRLENDESHATLPQALSKCYHLQVLDIGLRGFEIPHIPNDINNLVSLRHLVANYEVCSSIANIGKMTSLQELDDFIVQNSLSGFEVTQLKSMNKLVQLGVSRLENVRTKEEACGAKLKDKQHLEKLHLSWDGYDSDESYENEYGSDMNIETEVEELPVGDTNGAQSLQHHSNISSELSLSKVLDGLEPHHRLKNLGISGYNGATSPTWLLSSLTCLQTLHLEKCGKWQKLPLKGLSLLIKLVLIKMRSATEISIPSLEQLVLIDLPSLNTCSCTSVRDLNSSLRVLEIKSCPALEVFPLFENCQQFEIESRLSKLTIYNCPLLCVHNPLPPSSIVSKLSIENVSTLPTVQGSSTRTLKIGRDPKNFFGLFDQYSDQLETLDDEVLSFRNLRFLTGLTICGCQNLATISLESLRQLVCLKSLELYNCPELLSSNVPSELTCECMSGANHSALPSLERLHIEDCGITGKWLSLMLQHAQALQELSLCYCKQISGLSIGEPCFPGNLTRLKKLVVRSNQSLTSLQLCSCTTLQELIIENCESLNSLHPCFEMNLTCLKKLEVSGTASLKSPELQSCTALEHLKIIGCASLATLEGLQFLHALRHLEVYECPSLPPYWKSLSGQDYELVLCPRLERLGIDDSSVLTTSLCKHLTSLQRLELYGRDVARLTDEQERALQLLTSLQELRFEVCYNLIDLPTGLHSLPSLKRLEICGCRSIARLPEKGLPPSLEELDINYCSKELVQQCRTLASSTLKVKINGDM